MTKFTFTEKVLDDATPVSGEILGILGEEIGEIKNNPHSMSLGGALHITTGQPIIKNGLVTINSETNAIDPTGDFNENLEKLAKHISNRLWMVSTADFYRLYRPGTAPGSVWGNEDKVPDFFKAYRAGEIVHTQYDLADKILEHMKVSELAKRVMMM